MTVASIQNVDWPKRIDDAINHDTSPQELAACMAHVIESAKVSGATVALTTLNEMAEGRRRLGSKPLGEQLRQIAGDMNTSATNGNASLSDAKTHLSELIQRAQVMRVFDSLYVFQTSERTASAAVRG